jgi:hypothetical protein
MPLSFHILADRGLVCVKYQGFIKIETTAKAFAQYMAHPDCRPGQKQLVDMRGVTGFEKDYAKLMAMQAQKAEQFTGQGMETLIVYLVDDQQHGHLARVIIQSWDGLDGVVARIQTDEADALELLGQPERTVDELLRRVS